MGLRVEVHLTEMD